MKVSAKFNVSNINKRPYGKDEDGKDVIAADVILNAVQDEIFGPATPSGSISMTILNVSASQVFEDNIGKDMMLEFTPVE